MRTHGIVWRVVLAAALSLCLAACRSDEAAGPDGNGGGPTVTGPDTIAPAAVTGLLCTSPAARSLTLQWIAPGDDGMEGTAEAYDIRYHDSEITTDNWDDATRYADVDAPRPGGSVEQTRVLDLNSNTTYHFALRAADDAGNWSPISNSASGTTTNEATPPGPVTDLQAIAIDSGVFLLTWTATGDDGYYGTASTYDIRYAAGSSLKWETATPVDVPISPKAVGEPESLVVSNVGTDNSVFAMRVADEVPNWSGDSNRALALSWQQDLWRFPAGSINRGEQITLVFRAPPSGDVRLTVRTYSLSPPDCMADGVVLAEGILPGVHTITYDFTDESGAYLPTFWAGYQIQLCWDGVHRARVIVDFKNE